MKKSAVISEGGQYRFLLERQWGDGQRATFVMLNPSTADAGNDDPTIRRCIGYAKRWGYGKLAVVNLFSYRSTDPRELRNVSDPIGPQTDDYLIDVGAESAVVVAAWGNHGKLYRRDQCVRGLFERAGIPLHYLRLTDEGQPWHPLYLPAALSPQLWEAYR